jgi:cyclopropane fatty-acyl-phospholipid synthase-like methyltransferase
VINFNTQLSQADAQWIIEDVFPKAGYRINHDTLAPWRDAHNKAFTEQVSIPGCSCEYIQTYNVWHSRLHQYSKQIEDIAYPIIMDDFGPALPAYELKPKGRKKK